MSKRHTAAASDHARAWTLFQSGQLQEALRIYTKICRKARGDDGALLMQGIIHARLGDFAEAAVCLRKSVANNPRNFDALVNLGLVCCQQGRIEESLQYYHQALTLNPRHADTLFQTGNACARLDLLAEAEDRYRQALEIDPTHVLASGNLANVLACQGRAGEAVPLYRKVLQMQPLAAGIHSNLLLCMHYSSEFDAATIFAEHRKWAALHAAGIQPCTPDPAARRESGRLRIAYVTPDFREHSVAYFLEPLLANHDRRRYEVFCYADLGLQDATTQRLAPMVDCLRDTRALSDAQVAEMVSNDRIDILVDLAGHTENNRLLVFARRPAPLQISYLGYPDTTGLDTIDYRLTDRWADPPGDTGHLHTERLLYLDSGFLCFAPPVEAPEPASLPYDANGHITFGSFNVLTKIPPEMLALWGRLLERIPDARLLIKNRYLTDPRIGERIREFYDRLGIGQERLYLLGRTSKAEHMATYSNIDIALDSYPYHGTTTTCDSLWMGIPVVTLAGGTHVSRVGVSLMTRVGLEEMVAQNEQQYLDIAAALAADPDRLRQLRAGLRDRMRQSSLCDGGRFCADLESRYQQAWSEYCGST